MSKYLVTISWQDNVQPLLRHKETLTVDIGNIGDLGCSDILYTVDNASYKCPRDGDIAIDFMMEIK